MNVKYAIATTIQLLIRGTKSKVECNIYKIIVDGAELGFCIGIPEYTNAEPVFSNDVPLEYYSHHNNQDLYYLPNESGERRLIKLLPHNKTEEDIKLYSFIRNRKAMVQ